MSLLMAHRTNRLAAVLTLALMLSGCAAASMRTAQQAESLQDYDRAVAEYTALRKKHPNNQNARLYLERARIRAAQDHHARARRLEAEGKPDQALVELQIASDMNPTDTDIDKALNDVRAE